MPGPVADAREALAHGEDRGAVAGPGRRDEERVRAAGDRRHLARRHLHGDRSPDRSSRSGSRPPVRGEGDPRAVRRPGGRRLRGRARSPAPAPRPWPRRRATGGSSRSSMKPVAVVLVGEAVDVAVVGQRRLAGLGLGRAAAAPLVLRLRGAERARQHRRAVVPSGRPGEARSRRAAGPSGGAPRRRRAAAGGPGRSPGGPSPRSGRSGSSSTSSAAVRDERERPAVGRESRRGGPRARRW